MSTASLLMNGESKAVDLRQQSNEGSIMVTGYKELCLGRMDNLKENTNQHFSSEFNKHVYAPALNDHGKDHERNDEIPHMKELLLIHLDFIQQQSEQLTTKEKQISDLKIENEMLKLRIDRMERRVSLQKNRVAENGPGPSPDQNSTLLRSYPGPSSGDTLGRRRRRRSVDSLCSTISRSKRHCIEAKRALRNNLQHKEDGETTLPRRENHLMSEWSYYTTIGEQECIWASEMLQSARPTTLEVPKWRIKPFSSSYTMEGTENLSEDVFDRRHFRLSIDEKRRKRWDVQRIREERHNERLRAREKGRRAGDEAGALGPTSFWPSPHPRLTLAVDDSVPVCVFGIPVLAPPPSEFSLPWLSGKEPSGKPRALTRRNKR